MIEKNDLTRLRQEYDNRKLRIARKDLYSHFYEPYLFSIYQRQRDLLKVLRKNNLQSLQKMRILEIGCGGGGVLLECLTIGSTQKQLFGIDLLFDRLVKSHLKLPTAGINCANGQFLPFHNSSFDLVLQYTAFSSVLDTEIKKQMAIEMLRVLKQDGLIIWYDFWLNPTNPQTRGIRPNEIKTLFPNCIYQFNKITLAPPISRLVVPISWGAAMFLESLKFLNSHYLVVIQKVENS